MFHKGKEENFITKLSLKWFGRLFDVIIMLLMVALVATIVSKLFVLFTSDLWLGGVKVVITEILFVLILVELFTILTSYLESGKIKVQRIVEVGIISIIREVMFVVFEISALQIFAISGLLLVFALLFVVERYFSSQED